MGKVEAQRHTCPAPDSATDYSILDLCRRRLCTDVLAGPVLLASPRRGGICAAGVSGGDVAFWLPSGFCIGWWPIGGHKSAPIILFVCIYFPLWFAYWVIVIVRLLVSWISYQYFKESLWTVLALTIV